MRQAVSQEPPPPLTHRPVLLAEVLETLAPRDDALYLDATFGRGGYSRALLEAADCRVIALDCDPEAVAEGQALAARFAGRLRVFQARFGAMDALASPGSLAGITLDLGVSSPQLDRPERGFSFRADGPLDMRMSGEGPSAAEFVNHWSEKALAEILWRLGEERRSRAVAKALVAARRDHPITRTFELAEIVRTVVRPSKDGLDPATRSFQALRMAVNDELGELERALAAAERLLCPGGVLVVVAFHSLEDRLVKDFLRERSGRSPKASRHLPLPSASEPEPTFLLPFTTARRPGRSEVKANPRAASARLRAGLRTAAPAWEKAA